jgi:CPA2 family monovalent cation:H+ antiporter-2
VLANTATEESADLIVVGARGHTIVMSLLLGHTADRLLRVALTPVMCVHADDTPRTTRRRTVLAATDLSAEGNAAIGLAARVLAPFGSDGRLVVVNVESTPPFYESEPPATAGAHEVPDITAKALERLDELVAPHRESGLEVVTAAVPGYAPSAIEEQAAEYEADWIVMGSRGESALEAMLIGSVAERVLHHSARPVLLVPEAR